MWKNRVYFICVYVCFFFLAASPAAHKNKMLIYAAGHVACISATLIPRFPPPEGTPMFSRAPKVIDDILSITQSRFLFLHSYHFVCRYRLHGRIYYTTLIFRSTKMSPLVSNDASICAYYTTPKDIIILATSFHRLYRNNKKFVLHTKAELFRCGKK